MDIKGSFVIISKDFTYDCVEGVRAHATFMDTGPVVHVYYTTTVKKRMWTF